jgi:hypothetical protein
VDVTPAPRKSSYQQKTPAAGWQARGRVGIESLLSRHADVRGEALLRYARRNNSRLGRPVNSARRYVLRSGRTVGRPSKTHVWSDVVSVDAPCRNRALPRRRDARMFRVAACPFSCRLVTQSRVDLTARHAELGNPIPGTNRCQDPGTLADFPAHDGCARRTPRHPPFGVRDRPS